MYRILFLAFSQSALLALGQVFLKIGLSRMLPFGWNGQFWMNALLNWPFALSGLLFGGSSVLWMYIVKHYPLSVAYPMISLSYVFGLFAAASLFHEQVGLYKWLGVALIVGGCCLIGIKS